MAEAQARILAAAPAPATEAVALDEAAGLVLARDVVAERALPGFDNSAMDGFAVRASDVAGASDGAAVRLRIAGEVAAGSVYSGAVEPATAVRIMTGAPMPAGADAVVEVEETSVAGDEVMVRLAAEVGRSVRRAGSDIAAGEKALAAGDHLGPARIALLAALGVVLPECIRRPRVAVLATGDELVDAGTPPGPGQVADIVGPGLGAAVRALGAEAVVIPRARDTKEDVRRALDEATARADVVVSVGGVSMGEYDLVRGVVEELGELAFWKVAMRPGKPLAVGRVGERLFIGLPGNPVSALVGFEVYVVPLVLALAGKRGWTRPRLEAELARPLQAPGGLRTFARAHLTARGDGVPLAHAAAGQGSHQLRSLAVSDALLDIPENTVFLDAGARVSAILVEQPPGPPLAGRPLH